jgi:RHS repeat-associated protein
VGNRWLFTGRESDFETGLYHFRARAYSPRLGRFLQRDPFGQLPDANVYRYVGNHPLDRVDPFGFLEARPGNDMGPWGLGWQWLTGTGPQLQVFGDGDPMTEMLRTHDHIQDTRGLIARRIVRERRNGTGRFSGKNHYSLAGIGGTKKYVKDYSTLLTGGATGNLAVTYLGSYQLNYEVVGVDEECGQATVRFTVKNDSTIGSATRPPVIGYSDFWKNNIGSRMNDWFSSGPMSNTSQEFHWTEVIQYGAR